VVRDLVERVPVPGDAGLEAQACVHPDGPLVHRVTIAIGLAATNHRQPPLFLVLGLMLASIVVSGILSGQSLKGCGWSAGSRRWRPRASRR
jgi:hypothetical protein